MDTIIIAILIIKMMYDHSRSLLLSRIILNSILTFENSNNVLKITSFKWPPVANWFYPHCKQ